MTSEYFIDTVALVAVLVIIIWIIGWVDRLEKRIVELEKHEL